MRGEVWKPFKEWSLLYLGSDELIKNNKKPNLSLSKSSKNPTDSLLRKFGNTITCLYTFSTNITEVSNRVFR